MSAPPSGPPRSPTPARLARSAPVRTCVGCRQRAAKHELLRVVAENGTLVPDPAGRAPGRGAHLHPTEDCLTLALRRKAFGRALRVSGAVQTELLAEHVRRRRTGSDFPE